MFGGYLEWFYLMILLVLTTDMISLAHGKRLHQEDFYSMNPFEELDRLEQSEATENEGTDPSPPKSEDVAVSVNQNKQERVTSGYPVSQDMVPSDDLLNLYVADEHLSTEQPRKQITINVITTDPNAHYLVLNSNLSDVHSTPTDLNQHSISSEQPPPRDERRTMDSENDMNWNDHQLEMKKESSTEMSQEIATEDLTEKSKKVIKEEPLASSSATISSQNIGMDETTSSYLSEISLRTTSDNSDENETVSDAHSSDDDYGTESADSKIFISTVEPTVETNRSDYLEEKEISTEEESTTSPFSSSKSPNFQFNSPIAFRNEGQSLTWRCPYPILENIRHTWQRMTAHGLTPLDEDIVVTSDRLDDTQNSNILHFPNTRPLHSGIYVCILTYSSSSTGNYSEEYFPKYFYYHLTVWRQETFSIGEGGDHQVWYGQQIYLICPHSTLIQWILEDQLDSIQTFHNSSYKMTFTEELFSGNVSFNCIPTDSEISHAERESKEYKKSKFVVQIPKTGSCPGNGETDEFMDVKQCLELKWDGSCADSLYGCCQDEISTVKGPFFMGCPKRGMVPSCDRLILTDLELMKIGFTRYVHPGPLCLEEETPKIRFRYNKDMQICSPVLVLSECKQFHYGYGDYSSEMLFHDLDECITICEGRRNLLESHLPKKLSDKVVAVNAGESIIWLCESTSRGNVSWFKLSPGYEGELVQLDNSTQFKQTMMNQGKGSLLEIQNISMENAGFYACRILSEERVNYFFYRIIVLSPMEWIPPEKLNENLRLLEGQKIPIRCEQDENDLYWNQSTNNQDNQPVTMNLPHAIFHMRKHLFGPSVTFYCSNKTKTSERQITIHITALSCDHTPQGCCTDQKTPLPSDDDNNICPPFNTPLQPPCQDTYFGCCLDGISSALGPHQLGCSTRNIPFSMCLQPFSATSSSSSYQCSDDHINLRVRYRFDMLSRSCLPILVNDACSNNLLFATLKECQSHCVESRQTGMNYVDNYFNERTSFLNEDDELLWKCPFKEEELTNLSSHSVQFTWYRLNKNLTELETNSRILVSTISHDGKNIYGQSHLIIKNVILSDSGIYVCEMSGKSKSKSSINIPNMKIYSFYKLVVSPPEKIILDERAVSIRLLQGQKILFECPNSFEEITLRRQMEYIYVNRSQLIIVIRIEIYGPQLEISCRPSIVKMNKSEDFLNGQSNNFFTFPVDQIPCSSYVFGCCSDGETIANDLEGTKCPHLDCKHTQWGCCNDEYSIAQGPFYMGCPTRKVSASHCSRPSQQISTTNLVEILQRPCHSPLGGSVAQDKIRFHFVPQISQCQPILSHNECSMNNSEMMFVTLEECQQHCIYPSGKERCHLIPSTTGCSTNEAPVWFYDSYDMRCKQLRCVTNGNAFLTAKECENLCVPKRDNNERCVQPPKVVGSGCKHAINRVYYDVSESRCEWFKFSGCSSNENRFPNSEQCKKLCFSRAEEYLKKSNELCFLPMDPGFCSQTAEIRWYFDKRDQLCKEFHYSLCGGNSNNFLSRTSCEAFCGAIKRNPEVSCLSPFLYGDCYGNVTRFYFDKMSRQCVPFTYSGCGGNANNYLTMSECSSYCHSPNDFVPEKEQVFISSTASTTVSIESTKLGTNITKPLPQITESPSVVITSPNFKGGDALIDGIPCFEKPKSGNCLTFVNRTVKQLNKYFYNSKKGSCMKYNFTGCQGSANSYDKLEDCIEACQQPHKNESKEDQLKYCSRDAPPQRCIKSNDDSRIPSQLMFHYQSSNHICVAYQLRNDNSYCLEFIEDSHFKYFSSVTECYSTCKPEQATESRIQNRCFAKAPTNRYICPPAFLEKRWFYYREMDECLEYTTCAIASYEGNSFESKRECELHCIPTMIREICRLPMDKGPCEHRILSYYYEFRLKKCIGFPYSGCLGNWNRFVRKRDCEEFCVKEMVPVKREEIAWESSTLSPEIKIPFSAEMPLVKQQQKPFENDFCLERHFLGTCDANRFHNYLVRYYYNSHSGECEKFHFTGCGAMRNNFMDKSSCERICRNRIIGDNREICRDLPKMCPGNGTSTAWYYHSLSGLCQRFTACDAKIQGGNQFSTERLCLHQCKPPNPLAVVVQDRCHMLPMRTKCPIMTKRWYFDPQSGTCKSYTSCASYGNFPSIESCHRNCLSKVNKNVCQMKIDPGACVDFRIYWAYDWLEGRCKRFYYGGCFGNRNRFNTEQECKTMCYNNNICLLPVQDGRDICSPTPDQYKVRYYYNVTTHKCEMFYFTGCHGNANNFLKKSQCQSACEIQEEMVPSTSPPQVSRCLKEPPNRAKCEDAISTVRFFYENISKTCLPHEGFVCLGESESTEENSFTSPEHCIQECNPPEESAIVDEVWRERCAAHRNDEADDSCAEWLQRYSYNSKTNSCEFFWFPACETERDIGNRFTLKRDCEQMCLTSET